ncbi:probable serine/threonine-protein kinase roco5 [Schistocerca gregaria]|uniref:probable serine/threonine-protein kinase roco5 n=1 Tax=Schistocerca gregaria TaxID=7010 RepID=UPI00211F0BF3|nr:probable serine/threonine-protein kinase roco5 [Schistocerca gregaria]
MDVLWPEGAGEEFRARRSLEFERLPEGVFGGFLARLLWNFGVCCYWRRGAVLSESLVRCMKEGEGRCARFGLEECEGWLAEGESVARCARGHGVRLDLLCPELCLYALNKIEVDARELEPCAQGERGLVWLMSGIDHPNVVRLRGYGLRPDPMIVMEYIKEGDLHRALCERTRSLSWAFRLRVALDIARGMAALHAQVPPLCHADLKSPNCMIVSWDERAPVVAKVSDFGLAVRVYRGRQNLQGSTKNPFWAAPEILSDQPFDTSADCYSFGVILWNLLTRKTLFEEHLPCMENISRAVRAGKRPDIPVHPDVHPNYLSLIKSCWHQDPSMRPPFSDICQALSTLASRVPATPLPPPTRPPPRRPSPTPPRPANPSPSSRKFPSTPASTPSSPSPSPASGPTVPT